MKSQPFPRFAYFTALLVLLPSLASAQVSPYPLGVSAPIFGLPASAVSGGGGFSPQLLGPESCTVPAYSFITAPTNGWGGSGTTTACAVIGGTQRLGITSTAVTSTVPIVLPAGTAAATSLNFGTAGTGWYQDSGTWSLSLNGTSQYLWGTSQFFIQSAAAAVVFGTDATIGREAAAVLQMGVDAAGVTDQMFKGPDRITSDGVGGNLTIAGGRNRGASAGGSIIFQTAPAAGAGVTGTLATALTINSAQQAVFSDLAAGTPSITFTGGLTDGFGYGGAAILEVITAGATNMRFDNVGDYPGLTLGAGASLKGGTSISAVDTNFKRTAAGVWGVQTTGAAAGSIALGTALAIAGTAPTAAGTGMAFTVGTGSTAFDWSITITTANAQSAFVLTLPTAANAWTCDAFSFTNPGTMKIGMSARTTTSAGLTQYAQTTGLAAAYADGNVIIGRCTAH